MLILQFNLFSRLFLLFLRLSLKQIINYVIAVIFYNFQQISLSISIKYFSRNYCLLINNHFVVSRVQINFHISILTEAYFYTSEKQTTLKTVRRIVQSITSNVNNLNTIGAQRWDSKLKEKQIQLISYHIFEMRQFLYSSIKFAMVLLTHFFNKAR